MKNNNLTTREFDVLYLLQKGFSNEEIAKRLQITHHTVKAHIASILKKLSAKNRVNAVYIANQKNLL